jgi:hypothetical protein
MMRAWLVQADLPEPSHVVVNLLRSPLEKAQVKSRHITLDFAFERDFSTRKKAYGHRGVSDCRKPAGPGIPKFSRDKLIADLGGPGRNIVQTVVAHGGESPILEVYRHLAMQMEQNINPQAADPFQISEKKDPW